MKLSLYTFVKDGLRLDYHVVPMLKYHANLFDEIVVVEGYSTDGTYDAICDIDTKIHIVRKDLGPKLDNSWMANAKDDARKLCTGDWCVMLDCDEFMPEWEFERMRVDLSKCDDVVRPVTMLHFYGSYKTHMLPMYSHYGFRVHRNFDDFEVWGDGMNVRQRDVPLPAFDQQLAFKCHHFGEVRWPARLREKWRAQGRMYKAIRSRDWMPSFLFDLFPHRWCHPDHIPNLRIYEGPYIPPVLDDPNEFVRDDFEVYRWARALQGEGRLHSTQSECGACLQQHEVVS